MFVTVICTILKSCKKYKNQYKKQKITYYHCLHSNCYNTKVWTLSIRLSEISWVVFNNFNFPIFFVLIIYSKISIFNSRNATDVTHSKKTTQNSLVTRENNQQIKFLNNWTEQSCLLPVTHHEINLPLSLHNPKCTSKNNFYEGFQWACHAHRAWYEPHRPL